VCGSSVVMAWDNGHKVDFAVIVGLLDAAKPGCLVVGWVVGVAVAGGNDTAVDARGVGLWTSVNEWPEYREGD
jgi:hypothetical protein